jgi:hypothetical protein
MEKIVFSRYDVKMAYYQSRVKKTRFNPYIDKLIDVHYILHLKNNKLGLHNRL